MVRRRAAILFADVVGYSRLTERDEEGTHRTLRAYFDVWSDFIRECGGRIVNCAGDALLAEMPDAARALSCAVGVHQTIRDRNRDVPVDRRLRFRVGINTGNVIVDPDDIYGEGVNIAARLAGRAQAGGICISEADFSELQRPANVGFEFLGDLQVKNIAKPIGAYKVLLRPEDAGKILSRKALSARPFPRALMALAVIAIIAVATGLILPQRPKAPDLEPAAGQSATSLLAKPSITVLPFQNLTGDPEQALLAESITDGISAALAKFSNLSVSVSGQIGSGGTTDAQGAERKVMGVPTRYVLHGAVRRSPNHIRITTQLFDQNARRYVWGGRYDTALNDVFSSDNGVIDKIAAGLWTQITQNDETGSWRNEAGTAEAYRLAVIGLQHYRRFTPADNTEAKYYFRRTVTLDPEFLTAWAGLGWSYFNEAQYGWGENPQDSLARASALATKVLEIDPSHAEARALESAIKRNSVQTEPVFY